MGKGDKRKLPKLAKPAPVGRGRRKADRGDQGQFVNEDPRKTVLAARARHMGCEDTKEHRLQQTGAHLGDDVGRCIQFVIGAKTREQRDEVSELWKTWTGFCASRWHYRRRILGQTGHPKGMNLQILPEVYETDQSHSVDVRTEDERDEAARQSYALWNARVSDIQAVAYQSLLHSAENGHVQIVNGTVANPRGCDLVRAIMQLRDVVQGE